MGSFVRSAFALFLMASLLFAGDWSDLRSEAKGQLKNPDAVARLSVVERLMEYQTADALTLLVEHWKVAAGLSEKDRMEHRQLSQEMDELESENARMAMSPVRTKMRQLEARIEAEDQVLSTIRGALNRYSDGECVEVFCKELKRNKDGSFRLAIADRLRDIGGPEVADALIAALKKDKDPRVRISAAATLGKRRTREAYDALVEVLQEGTHWQLTLVAADALESIGDPRAIGELIAALPEQECPVRDQINAALGRLTGENKNGNRAAWQSWWEANQAELLEEDVIVSGDDVKKPEPHEGTSTFYGIPVNSKRIVFVLDRSGSMSSRAVYATETQVEDNGGVHPKKIEVCKNELKNVVRKLPEDAYFNVIFYNSHFKLWKSELVPATAANKAELYSHMERINANGNTNIYDSLIGGFDLGGAPIPKDSKLPKKGPGVTELAEFLGGVDTIYLLSDGVPNKGTYTGKADILEQIARVNATRNAIIHTIEVGGNGREDGLMAQLAKQNNGTWAYFGKDPNEHLQQMRDLVDKNNRRGQQQGGAAPAKPEAPQRNPRGR
jgi:hypothetical protein